MIRICHVQLLPLMSGVQRAMLAVLAGLDRRVYDVHVVCKQAGPLTDVLHRQGIATHYVPSLDRAIHPRGDWLAYRGLCSLFSRLRPDLVHTHSTKTGILGRRAARRARVPHVVHTVHGFAFHEFMHWSKRAVYQAIERRAARFCDRLVFVNHEEHLLATNNGWLSPDRCHTIFNGVDLQDLSPQNREPDRSAFRCRQRLAKEDVAILFNARLEPQKQPLILAEIAARLNRLRPSSRWRLFVAGDGSLQCRLAQRIEELGLTERVSMLGWTDNLLPALRAADIALLPSLYEGLPLGLLEAHAMGIPSVASNAKGNREAITPSTGILCPVSDGNAYAEALAVLIDSPGRRKEMGHAARQRAEMHFDVRRNSHAVVELYEELLNRGPFASTRCHAHRGRHSDRGPINERVNRLTS